MHQGIILHQLETVIFLLKTYTLLLKISFMKIRKELFRNFIDNLHILQPEISRLNADAVDGEVNEIIEQISDNCNVCKRFKRTPARPVVCMPLASKFNQVIAVNLTHFKDGVYFLHLIDLFSRFSLFQVLTRKLPSIIVDALIKMWIASGFGGLSKFLINNGGEFANNLY